MDENNLLQAFVQLGMFSAFIHAIIEVLKGISAQGLWGIVKDLWATLFRDKNMEPGTMKTMVFVLAVVYCIAFDYDAMTKILGVDIAEESTVAWYLAYAGTSAVVYVGVEVFYGWIKKMKSGLNGNGAPKSA